MGAPRPGGGARACDSVHRGAPIGPCPHVTRCAPRDGDAEAAPPRAHVLTAPRPRPCARARAEPSALCRRRRPDRQVSLHRAARAGARRGPSAGAPPRGRAGGSARRPVCLLPAGAAPRCRPCMNPAGGCHVQGWSRREARRGDVASCFLGVSPRLAWVEGGDSAPISRGARDSPNICPVFIFPKVPIQDWAPLRFLLCIAWDIGLHSLLCLPRGCQWVTLGSWAPGLGSLGNRILIQACWARPGGTALHYPWVLQQEQGCCCSLSRCNRVKQVTPDEPEVSW